jgi:parallel beta-helix repeat protein
LVDRSAVGSGYNLLGWDSTGVANGTHLVTVKAYAKGSTSALGQVQLNLVVQNNASSTTLVNPQNPRNYGAKGNGTTDDTAAFRSAISHGDLHLTTGTYLINGGVSVPNYRNIECDSGVTLYTTRHSSTGSGILQWISTGYGSVTGCNFKGSNTQSSFDSNQGSFLIMLATATHVSIVNDTFKNAWGNSAVHISAWGSQPSSYNSVQGCTFQSNAHYGVTIIVGTYNTISYNNVIDSSMGDEVNHTYDANTGNVFSYNTVQGVNGTGFGQVFLTGGIYPSGANYGGNKVFSNIVTGRSSLRQKGPVIPAQYSANTCSSGCTLR